MKTETLRVPKVSSEESLMLVSTVLKRIAKRVDSLVARRVEAAIEAEDYLSLLNFDVDPKLYHDAQSFFYDYSLVSFIRKYEGLPTGIDKQAVALEKFLAAERQCKDTNDRLDVGAHDSQSCARSSLIHSMAREISLILGDCPSVLDLQLGFGPGATSSCKGSDISVGHKLAATPEVTREALPYLQLVCEHQPMLAAGLGLTPSLVMGEVGRPVAPKIRIIDYNQLIFVPKTGKTDRAICVEPTLNTMFQKGIGSHISRRLRWNGIDLHKQQDRNAKYAKIGSIDGSYATIDLSAASDTISASLVAHLLPSRWLELLSSFRSPFTRLLDGSFIENEKFSSMGNGYTFELETLIFYALVRVMKKRYNCSGEVMCFGDDIIVPTEIASETMEALQSLGFLVNEEKTFVDGPFRESCGKDYFRGHNVRPYFHKKVILNVLQISQLANGIRLLSARSDGFITSDPVFRSGWEYCVKQIPKSLRTFGPSTAGAGSILVPLGEKGTRQQLRNGLSVIDRVTTRFKRRSISKTFSHMPAVVLAVTTFGAQDTADIPRSKQTWIRQKRCSISPREWENFTASWRPLLETEA